MRPGRAQPEGEDNENVLELFLDVLLCGFGAALALVVVYSVLPKSGLAAAAAAAADTAAEAGRHARREVPVKSVAATTPGAAQNQALPVCTIILDYDAAPADPTVHWTILADGATAPFEPPAARRAPSDLPARAVLTLPAGTAQFTLLGGENFRQSGLTTIQVTAFFDGLRYEQVLRGRAQTGLRPVPRTGAPPLLPPERFPDRQTQTPLLHFDLSDAVRAAGFQ